MTPHQWSDDEIIRLILSNNKADREKAATYLITHYAAAIHAMVLNMTNGYLDSGIIVTDTVQDLIKAVRKGNYDPGKGTLEKYSLGICKLKILAAVRRRKERPEVYTNQLEEVRASSSEKEDSPDQLMFNKELRAAMKEALKKLDPDCRELIERYWYKGEQLKDIAKDLGISEAAIKKRHERCRKKLKTIFGKDPR